MVRSMLSFQNQMKGSAHILNKVNSIPSSSMDAYVHKLADGPGVKKKHIFIGRIWTPHELCNF